MADDNLYDDFDEGSGGYGSGRRGGKGRSGARQGSGGGRPRTGVRRRPSYPDLKVADIDYKKPEMLAAYMSEHSKILGRRRTGSSAKVQRRLALAIKRARYLALLPYTYSHKTKPSSQS